MWGQKVIKEGFDIAAGHVVDETGALHGQIPRDEGTCAQVEKSLEKLGRQVNPFNHYIYTPEYKFSGLRHRCLFGLCEQLFSKLFFG